MGRTRERAVCACDVVWVRMGSDVSRRRLPSGPRQEAASAGRSSPWICPSRSVPEDRWSPHNIGQACARFPTIEHAQERRRCLLVLSSCGVACPVDRPGRYHQVALPLPSASRRALALSLSLSLSFSLLLLLPRSSRSSSRANMRTQIRYMHANTCKQVSSCTSTHVYIIVKNVRITANLCAFTPACGYASTRVHT